MYVQTHWPLNIVEWWKAPVPINSEGDIVTGCIRNLQYDISLCTEEVLKYFDDLTSNGFEIYQSTRKIADTFSPGKKYKNFISVAKQNGIITSIEQPSPGDMVQYWTLCPQIYKKILENKLLASMVV